MLATKKKKKQKNVEQLRKEGYKVRVYHGRRVWVRDNDGHNGYEIMSRREFERNYSNQIFDCAVDNSVGFTSVNITTPDGTELFGKFNIPAGKVFDRKLGLKVALGRALKVSRDS